MFAQYELPNPPNPKIPFRRRRSPRRSRAALSPFLAKFKSLSVREIEECAGGAKKISTHRTEKLFVRVGTIYGAFLFLFLLIRKYVIIFSH